MPVISRICQRTNGDASAIPDIYQITVLGANLILVVEEKLTLIDTGYRGSGPHIIQFLGQLGRSPADIGLIILTHNHIDHVGGLAELKPLTAARVAIHKSDIGLRRSLPSARPEDIDIPMEGGEMLDVFGGMKVIHAPGHTPGSICLYSSAHKLAIVGDAMRRRRNILHVPHKSICTDVHQAVESVRTIARLNPEIICFGHGLPLLDQVPAKMNDLISRYPE